MRGLPVPDRGFVCELAIFDWVDAVGAKGRHVLLQLLVEAIVLSLVRGLVDVGLGFSLLEGLTQFLAWPTSVPGEAVVVAVGFAAATGIFFGFYPARKAAQLDPRGCPAGS